MYSYLVNDNSKDSKKCYRNVIVTIIHKEYKDVLLNKNCLKHSMNRTQSKDHKMGTYEINKIYLSCFDDKIFIQNYGCDGLTLS